MLNKKRCHTHFQFSANQITWSRLLIQVHILNDKQCRSRSVGFFRSQLIWIYTVYKDRVCPSSAGQGLTNIRSDCSLSLWFAIQSAFWTHPEVVRWNYTNFMISKLRIWIFRIIMVSVMQLIWILSSHKDQLRYPFLLRGLDTLGGVFSIFTRVKTCSMTSWSLFCTPNPFWKWVYYKVNNLLPLRCKNTLGRISPFL